MYKSTPEAILGILPPFSFAASLKTFAAAARSEARELVHDTRYALFTLILRGAISARGVAILTELGLENVSLILC
jgi:hypothetical protein